MEQDEKDLLKKTYELSKENNHILKGIRNASRWSSVVKVFTWILIIAVSLVAYLFVQPYIDAGIKTYNSLQNELNNVKTVIDKIPTINIKN